jgi:bifunctional DNA-binding transcriptional regulator/antitoxin component of YhaV-PrlF toxin-antitoxin module
MNLKEGDTVEFYADHEGRIMMRPRNRSTAAFLDALEPRMPDPSIGSDEEAIAKAVAERDARSRRRKAKVG